ncbi:MAG: hypothetical protein ACOY93_08460 [Bacillota bacterium]
MLENIPERNRQIIEQRIQSLVEAALPHGAGSLSAHRLTTLLQNVATVAFREGESYALASLRTIADVAQRYGITERRARTVAKDRHERFGIGWQVPGTQVWLFRESEMEHLRPGERGRPRTKKGEG